jgi:transcriptional regulator with XRE-family HTH domain
MGKTQKWLAGETNIAKTVINSGISRNSSPSVDTALKIAQTLGVSVEYLVTGKDGLENNARELLIAFNNLNDDGQTAAIDAVKGLYTSFGKKDKTSAQESA